MKFRTLTKDDVEVRVGTTKKDKNGNVTGVSLLLYKNARVDMAILDESVGAENWQRKHTCLKDNIYCSVGIRQNNGEWVWKEDCGVCAKGDEVIVDKGEASDSLKRACFNWGIGRELYTAPFIWINTSDVYARYEVTEMEVSEDHRITKLNIVDAKTKQSVFSFGKNDKVIIAHTKTQEQDDKKTIMDEINACTTSKQVMDIWNSNSMLQSNTEFKAAISAKGKELKAKENAA